MLEVYGNEGFEEIYAVMQMSFPTSEIRSKGGQEELLKDNRYKIYCYKEDAAIVGVLCVWEIEVGYFLEHFAILPHLRGRGIGSAMLKEFLAAAKQGELIFLEAEPITDGITQRRINFYKRMGFYLNNYDYCQPAFSPTLPAVPLKIMTYGKPLNEDEFLAVKRAVYSEVYHQKI